MHGTDDLNLSFENQAATDGKEQDKRVVLHIERHGNALAAFDFVDGDRKVAVVRESIQHNDVLPFMNSRYRKYQPVLDITVTQGTDMSLVRLHRYGYV